jgi:hypothetical protein
MKMKKYLLIALLAAGTFCQPAFAHEHSENSTVEETKSQADANYVQKMNASPEELAAQGWHCDKGVSVQISADVRKSMAEHAAKVARENAQKTKNECDCDDCDKGVCHESDDKKIAEKDCVDCVEKGHIA